MDYRVPSDFLGHVLDRLDAIGTVAEDRRDAALIVALVIANLAPLSFSTAIPPEALAARLGMTMDRWSYLTGLLRRVDVLDKVRRRRTSGQPQTLAVRLPGERLRGRQRAYVPSLTA